MAKKNPATDVPESLRDKVAKLGPPVSSDDVDTYGRLREIQDRSHRIRSIVKAWKDQQTQDRKLREKYAHWLMIAMATQAILVNLAFILLGVGVLTVEPWTARTFIMAVFGEIAALVLLVVKYLFTPSGDTILKYLDDRRSSGRKGRSRVRIDAT
jgi:hypothetical protein